MALESAKSLEDIKIFFEIPQIDPVHLAIDSMQAPLLNYIFDDFQGYIYNPKRFAKIGIPLAQKLAKNGSLFKGERSFLFFDWRYTDRQAFVLFLKIKLSEVPMLLRKHRSIFVKAIKHNPEDVWNRFVKKWGGVLASSTIFSVFYLLALSRGQKLDNVACMSLIDRGLQPIYLLDFIHSIPSNFRQIVGENRMPFYKEIIDCFGDKEFFIKNRLESDTSNPELFFAFAHCTDDPNTSLAFFQKALDANRWDCALATGHSLIFKGRKCAGDLAKFFLVSGKLSATEELIIVHDIPSDVFMDLPGLTPKQLSMIDRVYGPCPDLEVLRTISGLVLVRIVGILLAMQLAQTNRLLVTLGSWSTFRYIYILNNQ